MENDKIEIIFNLIINDLVLNDHTLFNCGFTSEDINELIEKKMIEPTKDGKYRLLVIEKFRKYGIKLISEGDRRRAGMCFRKCYEMAPNGRNICLQYLLSVLRRYDYTEAMKVYENLAKRHSDKYIKDDNLYLYLLSTITELEPELAKKAREFTCNDILLYENSGTKAENNIRRAIFQSKFTYAYSLLNGRIDSLKDYSLKYEILKILIIHALEADKKIKADLLNLSLNENYTEIVSILEKRKNQKRLSRLESYAFLITKAIIKVLNGEQLDVKIEDDSGNIYRAILNNDFKLALEINTAFLDYTGESPQTDIVNILLIKINELLDNEKNNTDEDNNEYYEEAIGFVENCQGEYRGSLLNDVEDIAYYIKSNGLTIDEYVSEHGLLTKYVLLIKLIYARDYYIDGNYSFGDKLVREVEYSFCYDGDVLRFLEEVKLNRDIYKNSNDLYTRKKIIQ